MVRVSAFFSAFSFLSLPSYGFLCEIAKLPKTDGPRPVLKNANFFTIRHALRVLLYTIDDDEWAVSGGDGQEGRSKFARAYFEQWWYTYFINIFFLLIVYVFVLHAGLWAEAHLSRFFFFLVLHCPVVNKSWSERHTNYNNSASNEIRKCEEKKNKFGI